jgi:hypothetical protein
MTLANSATLYQKIGKGAEGGHEFARFIKLLLIAHYKELKETFIAESDASGDYKKVDAYAPGYDIKGINTSYQFKFYPSKLSKGHKSSIEKSICAALLENPFMKEFVLVTPEDFLKEDLGWFDQLKNIYEGSKECRIENYGSISYDFKLTHWGNSRIIELALKNDHIGFLHFPELFPYGVGKFRILESKIDINLSRWNTRDNPYSYSQTHLDKYGISDPLFDFQFANNTPELMLLNRIEIHLGKSSTTINGPSSGYFLKSIGTIIHQVDFKKPVNTINLDDPMVFEASNPKRFNIQLLKFTEKCPGNRISLKFWFYFNNLSIPTEEFYLNF